MASLESASSGSNIMDGQNKNDHEYGINQKVDNGPSLPVTRGFIPVFFPKKFISG